MRVKTQAVIESLKLSARWVGQLHAGDLHDRPTRERLEDLVCGCLDLLERSPTTNIQAWIGRRPRRHGLDDAVNAPRIARTQDGRRAIGELLELTISELAASLPFLPDVEAGVLPVKAVRRLTAERNAALQAALKRHRERQRRLRTSRLGQLASGIRVLR